MNSVAFVRNLHKYFGPWRDDAGPVIVAWLDKNKVPSSVLDDVYLDLVECREIQPVNTISIKEIDKLLDRHTGSYTTLQIEGPTGAVDRDEGAQILADFREKMNKLCDAKNVRNKRRVDQPKETK